MSKSLAVAVLSLSSLYLAACSREVPAASYTAQEAPPELSALAARADPAFASLQQTLGKKLMAELGRGGPVAAVTVCRDEAQALSAQVAAEQGFTLGRTSHRLRNPANAAPGWAKALVAQGEGKRAAEVTRHVVDLGKTVGVLAPIPTGAVCLNCHGTALSPETVAAVQAAYPEDRATGFTEGALRGWFWAELPKD